MILEVIGPRTRFFVECGVGDGQECNTRFLREQMGFRGLMFDKDFENHEIGLYRESLTRENITSILGRFEVPRDFDVLSIDVDGIDFYLWQKISTLYRPRLVIIEYNASHSAGEDRVVPYDPNFSWDYTNYFGASISALHNLGRRLGYSLVYAESVGVNLFFILDEAIEQSGFAFTNANQPGKLYRPPQYGTGPNGGHAQDHHYRRYVTSEVAFGT